MVATNGNLAVTCSIPTSHQNPTVLHRRAPGESNILLAHRRLLGPADGSLPYCCEEIDAKNPGFHSKASPEAFSAVVVPVPPHPRILDEVDAKLGDFTVSHARMLLAIQVREQQSNECSVAKYHYARFRINRFQPIECGSAAKHHGFDTLTALHQAAFSRLIKARDVCALRRAIVALHQFGHLYYGANAQPGGDDPGSFTGTTQR